MARQYSEEEAEALRAATAGHRPEQVHFVTEQVHFVEPVAEHGLTAKRMGELADILGRNVRTALDQAARHAVTVQHQTGKAVTPRAASWCSLIMRTALSGWHQSTAVPSSFVVQLEAESKFRGRSVELLPDGSAILAVCDPEPRSDWGRLAYQAGFQISNAVACAAADHAGDPWATGDPYLKAQQFCADVFARSLVRLMGDVCQGVPRLKTTAPCFQDYPIAPDPASEAAAEALQGKPRAFEDIAALPRSAVPKAALVLAWSARCAEMKTPGILPQLWSRT